QHLVNDLWKPKLEALGITPVVFTYRQDDGLSTVPQVSQQLQSAVLQFRSQQVDHVMFTPDGGNATLLFSEVAENQGYRPRYAMNSDNLPELWYQVPPAQRPGALNISFSLLDLTGEDNSPQIASLPPNATRT